MPVVNSLLVRWFGGYIELVNPTSSAARGRKEGLLQLGNISTLDEATRIGEGFLALNADPRVATNLGVEPAGGGDEPFVDFSVGDTITAPDEDGTASEQRVVSLTVSEDDNGEVTYATELKETLLVQEEQFNRQLKLLLAGTMKGAAKNASPIMPPPVTNG